jgi:hypothetical protein
MSKQLSSRTLTAFAAALLLLGMAAAGNKKARSNAGFFFSR